jgi:hypothetical protein
LIDNASKNGGKFSKNQKVPTCNRRVGFYNSSIDSPLEGGIQKLKKEK